MFGFSATAQDTQAQIDSIMTLYPNCTDYPVEVLIVLDSLLVALENEQSTSNEDNDLFFNYLAGNYPNLIENGELNLLEASLITELNLDGLGLNNINGIEHFNNLEDLSCNNNNLTTVPELPSQITTLSIRSNNLNNLTDLPENLLHLDLRYNSLSTVPELPNNMESLKLCYNNFTTIPDLPDSLVILFFAYNDLDGLPIFPPKLEQALCYNNQISFIGNLPETIETLRIQNNNITSIPDLPNALQTLNISNNPIECVNSYPMHLEEQLLDFPTCSLGCTDAAALNYDINANLDDGACEYSQGINWPSSLGEINTDANATYLIENVLFNDSILSFPYTIGAFYPNDFGGLSCGGFTEWNGGPYSLAVFSDDLSTEEKDGFSNGDQIIWLAYSSDNNSNYMASATYISGSDLFSSNSINLISNFNILNDTLSIYGCTNEVAINYNEFSFIDDSSCIMPSELTITELNDSIVSLLSLVDTLNAELEEVLLQNPTEIISTLELALEAWNVSIDLAAGWNMFGYGCPSPIDVVEGLSNHTESVILVKNNNGDAYLPEWNFNGIGDLIPGFGYQIKLTEAIEGFSLCDWYVNDIPEDNIVSLQEENASLQAELDCYENPQIGDYCFGGIVFYVDSTGQHGLVAGLEDLQVTYQWDSAVQGALDYESNGFDDWYLPSIDELELIYNTIGHGGLEGNIGSFETAFYWSSSDDSNYSSWGVVFGNGYTASNDNNNLGRVRVIRAF